MEEGPGFPFEAPSQKIVNFLNFALPASLKEKESVSKKRRIRLESAKIQKKIGYPKESIVRSYIFRRRRWGKRSLQANKAGQDLNR